MFQSRSGFLPRRDDIPTRGLPCPAGFNPVLGFYRVATRQWNQPQTGYPGVSIPFWVSTASRPGRRRSRHRARACFNPVLGFYRVATVRERRSRCRASGFQSRSGFLPRRDRAMQARLSRCSHGFNPVLGFYRVATLELAGGEEALLLFQSRSGFLPRRDAERTLVCANAPEFQSRSGFLPRRDPMCQPMRRLRPTCFNPVLGFYRVATVFAAVACRPRYLFQSRSGFLPRRDEEFVQQKLAQGVFQSRSGFLPRRDRRGTGYRGPVVLFQSRSGFLPRRDRPNSPISGLMTVQFQSRSGFLPRRDQVADELYHDIPDVSIPFWVSTASRPISCCSSRTSALMFQSRSGFLPRRDRRGLCRRRRRVRFNPVLGFYRVATRTIVGRRRGQTVSIPFWVSTASRH